MIQEERIEETLAEVEEEAESEFVPMQADQPDSRDGTKRYLLRIRNAAILSQEETVALAKAAQAGDDAARNELAERNARLVVSLAKKQLHRKVPLDDLVSWGNIGLMKAIDKFDPDKGFAFSTYATKWIASCIEDGICESRNMVSRSSYAAQMTSVFSKTVDGLKAKLGRAPTDAEIAEASEGRFSEGMAASYGRLSRMTTCSMDASLKPDESDSASFGDLIADEGNDTPDEAYARAESKELLYKALGERMRERFPKNWKLRLRVLQLRFNLLREWEKGLTYDGAAAVLKGEKLCGKDGKAYTKERVRQIEEDTLRWLRKTPEMRSIDPSRVG